MRSPAAPERAEEATVEGGSLAGPAATSFFFFDERACGGGEVCARVGNWAERLGGDRDRRCVGGLDKKF